MDLERNELIQVNPVKKAKKWPTVEANHSIIKTPKQHHLASYDIGTSQFFCPVCYGKGPCPLLTSMKKDPSPKNIDNLNYKNTGVKINDFEPVVLQPQARRDLEPNSVGARESNKTVEVLLELEKRRPYRGLFGQSLSREELASENERFLSKRFFQPLVPSDGSGLNTGLKGDYYYLYEENRRFIAYRYGTFLVLEKFEWNSFPFYRGRDKAQSKRRFKREYSGRLSRDAGIVYEKIYTDDFSIIQLLNLKKVKRTFPNPCKKGIKMSVFNFMLNCPAYVASVQLKTKKVTIIRRTSTSGYDSYIPEGVSSEYYDAIVEAWKTKNPLSEKDRS
jgi:hypothetical protein